MKLNYGFTYHDVNLAMICLTYIHNFCHGIPNGYTLCEAQTVRSNNTQDVTKSYKSWGKA